MTLEQRVALAYKVPRVTLFINKDIQLMKRINVVLQRLDRTNNDIYILETFNILKTLSNTFDMNKLYLVLCDIVLIEYHSTVGFLIEQLASFDKNQLKTVIKKFQALGDE